VQLNTEKGCCVGLLDILSLLKNYMPYGNYNTQIFMENRMKPVQTLVALLTISLLVLAACGGNTPEPAAPPTATPAPTVAEVTQVEVKMLSPGDDARPPVGALDISKTYTATFKTDKGEFEILLFDDEAPLTVENFINLATIGFYEGTMFHRVIPDFMAQGGDPLGTGTGGPGYQFQDEFHASRQHDKPGVLSMANSGPGTNGSQFFITFAPTPHLDGMHSVFGEVVEGLDDALNITTRDPGTAQTRGDVITKIIISES
jgi:peptidyl-prolyl cis-trans isomerase B (cyclophilin B)